jgi:hypothetical protein
VVCLRLLLAYKDKAAPEIINEASYDPSAASDETLVKMIQMVHERGFHYLLLSELEWVITPEQREEAGCCDSIDEWMAFDSKYVSDRDRPLSMKWGENCKPIRMTWKFRPTGTVGFEHSAPYILHAAQYR